MASLKGKVAVVTGASEGIGEAIVRRLAAEGMKVAALARREDKLKILEDELTAKGYSVKRFTCDVTSEESVQAAFKAIDEDLGEITVLVNNAGVGKMASFADLDLAAYNLIFNTNVQGVLICNREVLTSMKKHSINNGHIVVINSVAGHRTISLPGFGLYSASKHAITDICKNVRSELVRNKSKTRVTSISPGLVQTAMTTEFLKLKPELPYLKPSDVADAVFYAVSAPSNVNVSEITMEPI